MTQQYDQNGYPIQPQQGQGQQPMQPAYQQQGYQQTQAPMRIDPNQVPDYLRTDKSEGHHNDLNAGAGVGGPRLSIKGKQFRFIEGDTERPYPFGQPLNVVLLTADPKEGVAKNFYGGAYVEGQDQSPICYSSDGITPDAGSESVQCATCANCPHNKFGTARNMDGTSAKGKACRDFKRVYVVPYDEPYSEVYELRVPPTSFKNMQTYGSQLDKASVKMHGVVTQLNFTADTSPVLTFTFAGYLDQQVVQQLDQRINSGELDSVRPSLNKRPAEAPGQSADPAQGSLPAPDNVAALGAPQPQPGQPDPNPNAVQPQPQPTQPVSGVGVPPAPGPSQPPAPPAQASCPLGAPQGYKMTDKGKGVPYQAFTGSGWTDQTLLSEGYMVRV